MVFEVRQLQDWRVSRESNSVLESYCNMLYVQVLYDHSPQQYLDESVQSWFDNKSVKLTCPSPLCRIYTNNLPLRNPLIFQRHSPFKKEGDSKWTFVRTAACARRVPRGPCRGYIFAREYLFASERLAKPSISFLWGCCRWSFYLLKVKTEESHR